MVSAVLYLAVIAVLVTALVYAFGRMTRSKRLLDAIEKKYGLKDTTPVAPRGGALRKNPPSLKPRTLEEYRREVDGLIKSAIALDEFGPASQLSRACNLALARGKRLRPIILLETARATSQRTGIAGDAAEMALCLEYLHAASLVVDDLPAFDNDTVRRGEPSVHAAMGPAVAQMAAVSLVAGAFQNVCRQLDWLRENCPELTNVDRIGTRLCALVAKSLGAHGAAGGQYMDTLQREALYREHGEDAVAKVAALKTATFFEVALVAGWLVAGGEPDQVPLLEEIGRHVGTAFQLADDLGDQEADAARAAQGRPGWNYAEEYGSSVTLREIERLLNGARVMLSAAGIWTPLWRDEIFPAVRAMAKPVHTGIDVASHAPGAGVAEGPRRGRDHHSAGLDNAMDKVPNDGIRLQGGQDKRQGAGGAGGNGLGKIDGASGGGVSNPEGKRHAAGTEVLGSGGDLHAAASGDGDSAGQ